MCLSFDLFLYNMNDSLRDRSVLEIVNRKCCQFTNWKDSEISFIIFIPLFCYFNYLSVSEDVIVIYEVRDAINSLVGTNEELCNYRNGDQLLCADYYCIDCKCLQKWSDLGIKRLNMQ